MNNNMEKDAACESARKIIISTLQGEVEVAGTQHDQPGVCPHCHRAIPLYAVVLKNMDINKNVDTFTGSELAAKFGIAIGLQNEPATANPQHDKPGECPYCHKQIPINEIIFRENKKG